jgi:hypothetical protein
VEVGGVKATVAEELPGLAITFVGAPGWTATIVMFFDTVAAAG